MERLREGREEGEGGRDPDGVAVGSRWRNKKVKGKGEGEAER